MYPKHHANISQTKRWIKGSTAKVKKGIIEESLEDASILEEVKILETEVEKVTPEHQTPWLKQWTLHTVLVPEEKAEEVAQRLSKNLDYSHKSSWYADFKNSLYQFIVFKDKIFKLKLNDKEGSQPEYKDTLFDSDINLDFLAAKTEGLSGAELTNLISRVFDSRLDLEAEGKGWQPITYEDLVDAIPVVKAETRQRQKLTGFTAIMNGR